MGTAEVIYGVFGRLFTGIIAMAAALLLMARIFSFFYQSFLLSSDVLTATGLGMVFSAPAITNAERVELNIEFENLKTAVFGFPLPKTFVFISSRFPAMAPALAVERVSDPNNVKVYKVKSRAECAGSTITEPNAVSNLVSLSSKVSSTDPLFKIITENGGRQLGVLVLDLSATKPLYWYIPIKQFEYPSEKDFPIFGVATRVHEIDLEIKKSGGKYYIDRVRVCIADK